MMHTLLVTLFLLMALVAGVQGQAQPASQPAAAPPSSGTAPALAAPEVVRALQDLMRQDARLRDWAQLGRYRDANRASRRAAWSKQVSQDQQAVVFLGDSITDAWPQPRFGAFFPGKPYVGRGISAQTTPQMLVRFRQDVIDLRPRAVVVLAGTNDIAGNTGPMTNEEIQANVASMCELARVHGIRVVLSSVLPVSEYHHKPGDPAPPQTTRRPMARIRALNEWMQAYAKEHGHTYLDYFSAMTDASGLLREDLSADDLPRMEKQN